VPARVAGKVPAKEGGSSTVQADLTVGSRRRKAHQTTNKYEQGRQRQGHNFSNANCPNRATQTRVESQRAGPLGQLLHR